MSKTYRPHKIRVVLGILGIALVLSGQLCCRRNVAHRASLRNVYLTIRSDECSTTTNVCAVMINGNPCTLFVGQSKMIDIRKWLREGENILELSGSPSAPVFLSVTDVESSNAKRLVDIAVTNFPYAVSFHVEQVYNPLWLLSEQLADSLIIRQSIRDQINVFVEYVTDGNTDRVIDWSTTGIKLHSPEQYSSVVPIMREVLSQEMLVKSAIQQNDYHFFFGRNLVFVYSGVQESMPYSIYLLESQKEVSPRLTGIHLARVEGRWIAW